MKTAKLRAARSAWIGTCAGVLMVAQMAGTARAATLTVPNEFENTQGNSLLAGRPFVAAEGGEFQQLYLASQFASFGTAGAMITSISFNRETAGSLDAVIPDLQIRLSATSRDPSSLSQVTSANFGPKTATVFRGPFTLKSGPAGSMITVPLQTPFQYQPESGNLLVDFVNHIQWIGGNSFDAHQYPGSGPYSVAYAEGAPGWEGNVTRGIGLIAVFGFEAIPEPGTFALAFFALLSASIWGCVVNLKRKYVAF